MRNRSLLSLALVAVLVLGLARCQQPAEQPAEAPPTAETPPAEQPVAPPVESDKVDQVRALQRSLRATRRRVREGNRQAGSLELSEAATLFANHAAASEGLVKENLEFSASEFTGMAERMFETPSVSVEEMDAALTRAFWALGAYHQQGAVDAWADGDAGTTAAHLGAAAACLDEAIGYRSGGVEEESEALIAQLRNLARALESPAADDNVSAQLDALRQELDRLGQQVREAVA